MKTLILLIALCIPSLAVAGPPCPTCHTHQWYPGKFAVQTQYNLLIARAKRREAIRRLMAAQGLGIAP